MVDCYVEVIGCFLVNSHVALTASFCPRRRLVMGGIEKCLTIICTVAEIPQYRYTAVFSKGLINVENFSKNTGSKKRKTVTRCTLHAAGWSTDDSNIAVRHIQHAVILLYRLSGLLGVIFSGNLNFDDLHLYCIFVRKDCI